MTTNKKAPLAKKTSKRPTKKEVEVENDKLRAKLARIEKANKANKGEIVSGETVDKRHIRKEIEAENEQLKAKLAALEKAKEGDKVSGEEVKLALPEVSEEDAYDAYDAYEDVEISMNKYVRVVSLCPSVLNLSTSRSNLNRRTFRFESFGQEKRIMYQYLVDIIENHPTFTESGFFFILDKAVVRRHGLEDTYKEVLRKEQIQKVFTEVPETALLIFNTANRRQQESIAKMLEEKLMREEAVDMNIVYKIGQVLGVDIAARVEDAKSYKDIIR